MWSRDRRMTLLHLILAGLDVSWFVPLFCLGWPGAGDHLWQYWGVLAGGTVLWSTALQVLDWLSPHTEDPVQSQTSPTLRPPDIHSRHPWLVMLLLAVSTLVLIHDTLYAHSRIWDWTWVRNALYAMIDLDRGLRPETLLLLTNIFLWIRASWNTNRNLTTLGIGNSFKLEFFLLLIASLTARAFDVTVPVSFVLVFLALGMLALTFAQSLERELRSQAFGKPLPLTRLAQLLSMAGVFLMLAQGMATYLPGPVNTVMGWVPFAAEIIFVILQLVLVLAAVTSVEFGRRLGGLMGMQRENAPENQSQSESLVEELQRQLEENAVQGIVLPPWALTVLRFLPLLILLLILAIVFWLVARRTRRRRRRLESEEEAAVDFERGDLLRRGLAQLRDLAGMVKRFGVGRHLLAAISVQNIYANLCRIAAHAGHPRSPATPPDAYLPALSEVFVGHEADLRHITEAYMRVHYGEKSLSSRELANVQAAYRHVRRKENTATNESNTEALEEETE